MLFRLHTASQVAVTCGCELIVSSFSGCWFELPDACSFVHQVSHHSFQPCPMNVCWETHSSCKLSHCLLHIESLSCHTEESARHSSIQSCQHFWELLLCRQVFFCHLETGRAHKIALLSMSMSFRLWSMYRLDVMILYPNLVRSTVRPRI